MSFRNTVLGCWPILPLKVKQMWWDETEYGRYPEKASEKLHDYVRAVMENEIVKRRNPDAKSIAALSASASMARLETGIGGDFD